MGWFEEQLKARKQSDDNNFEEALSSVAGAVMGKRLSQAYSSHEIANSAIDEILKYYHCKVKSDEIPSSLKTVDEQIEYHMRPFGIMRRTVKLDCGWYKNAVGAMLGTMKEDGRAIALIPGKISGYSYLDITTGKRIRVNRKNQDLIDSEAVCFYQPLPMTKLTVKDLLIFMAHTYSVSDVVLFVGMMAVMSVVGLISPLLTKWLFNDVLASGSEKMLMALAVFMICYSVCRLLLSAFQSLVNARIGTKQSISVQAAVMGRIMSLPASFFKDYASGELSQHASAVQSLCSTMMNSIGTVGLTSLFSLIYVGQIFQFAPSLVLPSIVITLATLVVTTVTTFAQIKITKRKMMISAKTNGLTVARICGQNPEQVFKTLVARGASKTVYIFVIPVTGELDLKKAAKAAGEKSVAMIHVSEINALTGYIRGGCSPVGMKKQYKTFFNSSAAEQATIMVSAGKIGYQVELSPDELIKLTRGNYADLVTE